MPATRFGVLVRWHDYGTGKHIHIKNCDIHHISGVVKMRFGGDGIMVVATGKDVPTGYADILIQDNTLSNIVRTGIACWSNWCERNAMSFGGDGNITYHQSNGVNLYVASTNVIVRRNKLDRMGGDGILLACSTKPLIEGNTAKDCNCVCSDNNAGIWPQNCDGAVVQYNEVYNTHTTNDGQGFDVDILCTNTLVQYNYSHGNEGGFLLVCGSDNNKTSNTIVRYNVIENELRRVFCMVGNIENTYIYNNTIFLGPETPDNRVVDSWVHEGTRPANTFFSNNIFYVMTPNAWYNCENMAGTRFDNNCFFGIDARNELADIHALRINPLLEGPGSGGIGLVNLERYRLRAGSPCIGAGQLIENNGGRDFQGRRLKPGARPSIGAFEFT